MRAASSPIRAGRVIRLLSSCTLVLLSLSLIAAGLDVGLTAVATQNSSRLSSHAASEKTLSRGDKTDATFTFSNPSSVVINDRPGSAPTSAAATPFPTEINVSGIPGSVGKVTVTLINFAHTWPDDVDVLLVGPTGQTVFLMSDAGGSSSVSNVALTFDDAAPGPIPDATVLSGGTFKPGNYPEERAAGTDDYPAPAPPGPYGTTLSAFNLTNPNGTWKLFVADDESGLAGNMPGGWSITITNSITAQNTNSINLPDSGTGSIYPSTADVSGLIGAVTGVSIILNGFSHTAPDDVDLLLVAPGGRSVVVMSDVGGSSSVSNLTFTLDDAAGNLLPENGPLVSGTFKPTDAEPGDSFPAPAPTTPPTGTTFGAFSGINPNGTWSLYALDDSGANAGSISGGWSLAIATSTVACSLNVAPSLQSFPITGGAGSFSVNTPFGCDWTATSESSFVTIISGSSGTGGGGQVNFTVEPNMGGGRTGTILVSSASFTRAFSVQQPSGCPFSLSQETLQFGGGGGLGNVNVTAAGTCGWAATTKDNWITITSGSGAGNGTVSFSVAFNPTEAPRTGLVTIGARSLIIMQDSANGGTVFDFDGDGKSDYAVIRPTTGTFNWYLQLSAGGSSGQQWGASDTVPVPGDYDGDGKWDLAVWSPATPQSVFYVLRSQTNTFQAVTWGSATDDPRITQDFDGDGRVDPSVTRYVGSGLIWYILESQSGNLRALQFGALSDVPVRGDFDGDGKADIGVYRRPSGSPANTFFVLRSSDGSVQATTFGNYDVDYIVPADFDGDGKTDFAVWRGRNAGTGNGIWYWQQSSDGAFRAFEFGLAGTDLPVTGDYDGDGRTDQAVWRAGTGAVFYVNGSTSGFAFVSWGASGDLVPAFSLQNR